MKRLGLFMTVIMILCITVNAQKQSNRTLVAYFSATGTTEKACALVAHEVRICAAKTCRACCLVCVDHDMMLCSLLYGTQIVVVHQLTVVVLAARNDVANVAALHVRKSAVLRIP